MRTNRMTMDELVSSEPFWTKTPLELETSDIAAAPAAEAPKDVAAAADMAERLGRALAPLLLDAPRQPELDPPRPAVADETPHLQYPPRAPVFGRFPEFVRA